MKLQKSPIGKLKIVLYYTIFGIIIFFLVMFIIFKIGILIGIGAGFALGIFYGVLGGKLEYTEHCMQKTRRRKVPAESNRIIPFLV